jgi:hypothetical protein
MVRNLSKLQSGYNQLGVYVEPYLAPHTYPYLTPCTSFVFGLSPSRRREAPCEGTNPPRLFTPGETKALAKSKVHQWSRAWLTNDVSVGSHPHWSQKIWRTFMNSGHWLVQFKVCVIITAWRQRNSKPILIWWWINFLQVYSIFARIFARFCKFQKLSQKERAKESAKRRERTLTKVSLF